MALAEDIGSFEKRIDVLQKLGHVLLLQDKLPDAKKLFEDSLALTKTDNRIREQSISLCGIATILSRQSSYEQALALFNKAIPLSERIHDVAGKDSALYGMAEINYALGRHEEASRLYRASTHLDHSQETQTDTRHLGT